MWQIGDKGKGRQLTLALLLGATILLGTGLRFYALGEKSLWGDEIYQVMWARQGLAWTYSLLPNAFEASLGIYVSRV